MQTDYYSVKEIRKITGASQSFCYTVIRKLRESFANEYPEAITIQGRIPKWYFEEKMMNKGRIERKEEDGRNNGDDGNITSKQD